MKVLVTFAVEAEFAPWRKLRHFRSIDYDGLRLWKTNAGEAEITALVTGIGTESASRAMGLMMGMADEGCNFDVCVSSGLAGALCEGLTPGDVVAPKILMAEDRLTTECMKVDEGLHAQALGGGAIASDCLFTTQEVLLTASDKKARSSKAQLVDMESFEIVKDARAWGARSVVVRAISDSVKEDLPIDFNRTLTKDKQVSVLKVVGELLKNPFALPGLLRFGKQSRQAAERLANFLDLYVQQVAANREVAAVARESR
jgi:adenosylhomocysteine nucleosidase